jgi:hypothetical protein
MRIINRNFRLFVHLSRSREAEFKVNTWKYFEDGLYVYSYGQIVWKNIADTNITSNYLPSFSECDKRMSI